MPGLPRRATSAVSSRETRLPEIDVSATASRHSRLASATAFKIRKCTTLALAHGQPFEAIQPINAIAAGAVALAPQRHKQPPVAKTMRLGRGRANGPGAPRRPAVAPCSKSSCDPRQQGSWPAARSSRIMSGDERRPSAWRWAPTVLLPVVLQRRRVERRIRRQPLQLLLLILALERPETLWLRHPMLPAKGSAPFAPASTHAARR